ncbi:hypothetical protein Sjap_008107 [Stephania japonica]|uniref:DUF4378 domain-containing protein n=1 Tax=Stephania japonica TaxID=461633 RepID=A0AAP0PAJ4_9MAGN
MMTRPFAVFDLKDGDSRSPAAATSKFREFPRLSLDSRAVVDGKGSLRPREIRTGAPFFENQCDDRQRRSPSVIARLMGLEALPEPRDGDDGEDESFQRPELRRSASESRSRDLMQYQYNEGKNSQPKQQERVPVEFSIRKAKAKAAAADEGFPSTKPRPQQRKCFFDSLEFYPETKQTTRSLYGEIEKRLKMRGIDEPEKDLETLKQILEALQLKGLLHSNSNSNSNSNNSKSIGRQIGSHQRNFVFDRRVCCDDSQIIVVQPSRFPSSPTRPGRVVTNSTKSINKSKIGNHRKLNAQQNRMDSGRSSPDNQRIRNNPSTMSPDRSPSSLIRRNPRPPLTVETQIRRGNESRNSSSAPQSPKLTNRSPKNNNNNNNNNNNCRNNINKRRNNSHQKWRVQSVAEDDESCSISECSVSSTPPRINATELRRAKADEEEKSVLERCDELLQSIAEMNGATESQQPSPVSVLDLSLYKDDSFSPPPLNRCLPFKDRSVELEEENWSASSVIMPLQCKSLEQDVCSIHDSDFLYFSEVLQVMDCVLDDSDFFLLEKQKYKSDSSYVSRLHRKLIFDVVAEIIDKKRQLPPWKAVSTTDPTTGKPWLHEIWSELLRLRENRLVVEDLFQVICGRLLNWDMAGDSTNGWRDCPILMAEVVLDVERSIFKDLIGETIRDLAGKHRAGVSRRMLMF